MVWPAACCAPLNMTFSQRKSLEEKSCDFNDFYLILILIRWSNLKYLFNKTYDFEGI